MRPAVAAMVAATFAPLACGGGDGSMRPEIDQIEPAIAAVEAELGGPQQFFEITAEVQNVRLFVAIDDATRVSPFAFVGGELAPAGAIEGAQGGTFTKDEATFDPDTILDRLDEDLEEPDIVQFSIGRNTAGDLDYLVRVRSDAGGVLDVTLGPDGAVLAVDPGTS